MKSEELYKLIEKEVLVDCFEIMKTKGESYSGLEDKLGNFKRCGKLAGIESKKALYIYLCKHWDSLSSFMRNEYKDSEKIEGRIKDIINYMFLLYALLKEDGTIK